MSRTSSTYGFLLGIETSCDETAAAVINSEGTILSNIISSQHDLHGKYGGVVPELASRRHVESIETIALTALRHAHIEWKDLQAIAVTTGPGLAGALLVGVSFAKSAAYCLQIPVLGINHLEGHIASAWLAQPHFPTPCIVLVVSGGHTHLYIVDGQGMVSNIGKTLDDAAGEAFDKAAKMLGLEYPGGPAIDRIAQQGNPHAISFPRSYLDPTGFDFSFSGLKTSLLYYLQDLDQKGEPRHLPDLAASFQEAIVDVLVDKSLRAIEHTGINALAVVGGVSANSRLRTRLTEQADTHHILLSIPDLIFSTDNAAMIALAGLKAFQQDQWESHEIEACAKLPLKSFPHIQTEPSSNKPEQSLLKKNVTQAR